MKNVVTFVLIFASLIFIGRLFCASASCSLETLKQTPTNTACLVYSQTPEEAFDNLLKILERMPFYKSSGYKVSLPTNPAFQDLAEHPEKIKGLDYGKYFTIFTSEGYKLLSGAAIQEILDKNNDTLLTVLARFQILSKKYGFKTFSQYKIIPILYGPGGRYYEDSGVIQLMVNDKGIPNSTRGTLETIIHEMVHIGIEDIIVRTLQLTHWEKEGLVDLICSLYFKDFLPIYKLQPSGDKNIQAFITYDNICNDLPGAVKQFIEKYPRKKSQ